MAEGSGAPMLQGWTEPNPSFPGAKLIHVWCPFCRGEHTHGLPDGVLGQNDHRSAHCRTDSGSPLLESGYYLSERSR